MVASGNALVQGRRGQKDPRKRSGQRPTAVHAIAAMLYIMRRNLSRALSWLVLDVSRALLDRGISYRGRGISQHANVGSKTRSAEKNL